jgi:hypothetical protein
MKGTVISYISDNPPRSYRMHDVPNVYDLSAINTQVQKERKDAPTKAHLGWYSSLSS